MCDVCLSMSGGRTSAAARINSAQGGVSRPEHLLGRRLKPHRTVCRAGVASFKRAVRRPAHGAAAIPGAAAWWLAGWGLQRPKTACHDARPRWGGTRRVGMWQERTWSNGALGGPGRLRTLPLSFSGRAKGRGKVCDGAPIIPAKRLTARARPAANRSPSPPRSESASAGVCGRVGPVSAGAEERPTGGPGQTKGAAWHVPAAVSPRTESGRCHD